jgi:lactoylglutathione lyase
VRSVTNNSGEHRARTVTDRQRCQHGRNRKDAAVRRLAASTKHDRNPRFETHVNVKSLDRAISFYRDVLSLPLAGIFQEPRVAFFWIGAPGEAMLGLWETGRGPQTMSLHFAFRVAREDVTASMAALNEAGITPLDFEGRPTPEPVVLAWMPALALYFRDPDENLLEFIAMLPDQPRPELGVVPWSSWPRSGDPA